MIILLMSIDGLITKIILMVLSNGGVGDFMVAVTLREGFPKTRLTYNCAHPRSTKEKKEKIIHNICSQKIMPYFFDKLSTSIRNFAQ